MIDFGRMMRRDANRLSNPHLELTSKYKDRPLSQAPAVKTQELCPPHADQWRQWCSGREIGHVSLQGRNAARPHGIAGVGHSRPLAVSFRHLGVSRLSGPWLSLLLLYLHSTELVV